MKCKILNHDSIEKTYNIKFPDGTERVLHKNIGRNIMIGKNSHDTTNIEAYYFSNEMTTSIELEQAKTTINMGGYVEVELKGIKGKPEFLHRMVAYSFIPFYNSKKDEVDHINGNKLDNRLENLSAVPPFYNAAKEFKNKNHKAKDYMKEAIDDVYKMADFEDLMYAVKFMLREENFIVFNEVSNDLTEKEIKAMIYFLEKNGFKVIKDDNK